MAASDTGDPITGVGVVQEDDPNVTHSFLSDGIQCVLCQLTSDDQAQAKSCPGHK